MRARPQRIVIERGGLRAEVDPANMPQDVAGAISRLLDEARPPEQPDAEPEESSYDVVLDYGDHRERLRYGETELPDEVRAALDARLA
jgi:emfourin